MSLELDNLKGVGPSTVEKLKDAGIMNIQVLATTSIDSLKGVGYGADAAKKLIRAAKNRLDEMNGGMFGFITGDQLLQQFKRRQFIKTGQAPLDRILGGGFETQKVYELYGPQGSGKSSLLHQLICLSMLPEEKGGLASPATVFLDCEGAFSIRRIKTMAEYYGLDYETVVQSVARANPATTDDLLYVAEEGLNKIMEQTGARLILLDSIATHFRAEYGSERQLFPIRQQKANRIIHALKKAATNYNAVAVLTNQVTANVNATAFSSKYTHSMGYTVGHESQVRILIAPRSKRVKKIKIEKAVDLANEEIFLELVGAGFINTVECDQYNADIDKSPEWHAKQAKKNNKKRDSKVKETNVIEQATEAAEVETPSKEKNTTSKTKKAKTKKNKQKS
ncbi:MAG: AAA family ATPase [Candidatus Helarchaeota archaeon]